MFWKRVRVGGVGVPMGASRSIGEGARHVHDMRHVQSRVDLVRGSEAAARRRRTSVPSFVREMSPQGNGVKEQTLKG